MPAFIRRVVLSGFLSAGPMMCPHVALAESAFANRAILSGKGGEIAAIGKADVPGSVQADMRIEKFDSVTIRWSSGLKEERSAVLVRVTVPEGGRVDFTHVAASSGSDPKEFPSDAAVVVEPVTEHDAVLSFLAGKSITAISAVRIGSSTPQVRLALSMGSPEDTVAYLPTGPGSALLALLFDVPLEKLRTMTIRNGGVDLPDAAKGKAGSMGKAKAMVVKNGRSPGKFVIKDKRLLGEDGPSPCMTDAEIRDGQGQYETSGLVQRSAGRFWLFCPGAKHRWIGHVSDIEGAIRDLDSDASDPLRFEVVKGTGYVYRGGKGSLTLADGKRITLPPQNP